MVYKASDPENREGSLVRAQESLSRFIGKEQKGQHMLAFSVFTETTFMHYVYILYSKSINKFYVGYSENPDKRLDFHNSELNKIWSKRGKPWELIATFSFQIKSDALRAEKFIKQQKSTKYIQTIIEQQTIVGFK